MKPLINLKSFLAVLLILIVPAALLVAYFRNYSPEGGGHEHGEKGTEGGAPMKMDGDKGAMKPGADSNAAKGHANMPMPQDGQTNSQPQEKTSQPSTAQAHPKEAPAKPQSRTTFAQEHPSMAMPGTPPGIPDASHLYHLGATGFFLDHPQHLTLNIEQQKALNQIKEQALLNKATANRKVEEAEQQLWKLTALAQPDTAQIEMKVREIEKFHVAQRLAFIGSVGEAAKVLTEAQTKILLGKAASIMPDANPARPEESPQQKPQPTPRTNTNHK